METMFLTVQQPFPELRLVEKVYVLVSNELFKACTGGQLMVPILHDRTTYGSSFNDGAA